MLSPAVASALFVAIIANAPMIIRTKKRSKNAAFLRITLMMSTAAHAATINSIPVIVSICTLLPALYQCTHIFVKYAYI